MAKREKEDTTLSIYRFKSARKYLRVSKSTLYNLVRDKKISYSKPAGLLYFSRRALDDYLERNGVLSTDDVRERLNYNIHNQEGGQS